MNVWIINFEGKGMTFNLIQINRDFPYKNYIQEPMMTIVTTNRNGFIWLRLLHFKLQLDEIQV